MADFAGETKGSGRAMWKQIARTKLSYLFGAPQRSYALHSNLLILAQPGGVVVRQDRARRHRSWSIHLCDRFEAKVLRYIRQYNRRPKLVKWKYFDPTRRIASTSTGMAH